MYAQLVSVVRAKTNRSVGEFPTFHNGSVVQLVAEHQDSAASGLGWPWIAMDGYGWWMPTFASKRAGRMVELVAKPQEKG